MLSPPTSHLLNEPSIDRRHFVVSRFPSHLAAALALLLPPLLRGKETKESLLSEVLPLFGSSIDLISLPTKSLKSVQRFLLCDEKRADEYQAIVTDVA